MTLLKTVARSRIRAPQLAGASFRRTLVEVRTFNNHYNDVNIPRFRELSDQLLLPVVLRGPGGLPVQNLPAQQKWFSHDPGQDPFTPYLRNFSVHPFPYELTAPQPTGDGGDAVSLFFTWLSEKASDQEESVRILAPLKDSLLKPGSPPFHQFLAPLSLLLAAHRFNTTSPHKLRNLYIAQAAHDELPAPLTDDLPAPALVRTAQKGDVYGTSIWMGLEPTYTPFHRDPNPNLFVQLRGSKTFRLLPPTEGTALHRKVLRHLGRVGNGRLRGSEMMVGPERGLLHESVWGHNGDIYEVTVSPGEALFVPLGWWHSVRSIGEDGDLNASCNWWFR
ncbi:hypothetical protein VUR80DRAFT_2834 [Thermomyces stellatus]